jgi:carbamoyltransferase
MVKKREVYRPFAPAVLEEEAHQWFELPAGKPRSPFMLFAYPVAQHARTRLGAVTHVDGTARVQTVSRADNPIFWELIHHFAALTGVPVVLNTSFNNHAEPIVDTVDDAVTAFLTTGLDALLIGNLLVRRREADATAYASLAAWVPPTVRLYGPSAPELPVTGNERGYTLRSLADGRWSAVSPETARVLLASDGGAAISDALQIAGADPSCLRNVLADLRRLWTARLIWLRPSENANEC